MSGIEKWSFKKWVEKVDAITRGDPDEVGPIKEERNITRGDPDEVGPIKEERKIKVIKKRKRDGSDESQ